MKKLALLGAGLAVVAVTVHAQQTPAELVKQQCASAKVTAEFWHGFTSASQQNVVNALAAEFNKTTPGQCVLPIPQGNYTDLSTKLKASFAAGKVPTMAQAFENNMALYLENDKLADLTKLGFRSNFLTKVFVKAATFNGTVYGAPFNKSVQLLFVNKDLFAKNNVKIPQTLSEMASAARELSGKTGQPAFWFTPSASTFSPIFFTLGGNYDATGKIVLNSPTAIKALDWLLDLVKDKAAKPITSGFINGQLTDTYGMSFDTSAGIPFYKSAAKFNLGITNLPGLKRGTPGTALIQGTHIVVFKDASSEQQKLGAKFLNFAMQPRNSAIFSTQTGYVPSSDLAQDTTEFKAFAAKNPDALLVVKQARYAAFEPRISDWEALRFNILETAIKEAVAGKSSAKDALDKAQKQAEDLLAGKTK